MDHMINFCSLSHMTVRPYASLAFSTKLTGHPIESNLNFEPRQCSFEEGSFADNFHPEISVKSFFLAMKKDCATTTPHADPMRSGMFPTNGEVLLVVLGQASQSYHISYFHI